MNASTILFLIIIIVNIIISAVIFIWEIVNSHGKISAIHLIINLLCPIVGPVFFSGGLLVKKMKSKGSELSYADIGFDASRHVKKLKSDFLEEVDILPLEEAFVVSETKDRRKALLSTLKKDFSKTISTVLLGLNNEDSETSHYAASVILSTISDYLNMLAKSREEFLNNQNHPGPAIDYLNLLREFMESNIIDQVDKLKYSRIYLETLSWIHDNFRESLTEDHYEFLLNSLIELDDKENAKVWANNARHAFPESDAVCYCIMKMHYKFKNYDEFLGLLQSIMSSNINFSNRTLQTIRFFTYRQ